MFCADCDNDILTSSAIADTVILHAGVRSAKTTTAWYLF